MHFCALPPHPHTHIPTLLSPARLWLVEFVLHLQFHTCSFALLPLHTTHLSCFAFFTRFWVLVSSGSPHYHSRVQPAFSLHTTTPSTCKFSTYLCVHTTTATCHLPLRSIFYLFCSACSAVHVLLYTPSSCHLLLLRLPSSPHLHLPFAHLLLVLYFSFCLLVYLLSTVRSLASFCFRLHWFCCVQLLLLCFISHLLTSRLHHHHTVPHLPFLPTHRGSSCPIFYLPPPGTGTGRFVSIPPTTTISCGSLPLDCHPQIFLLPLPPTTYLLPDGSHCPHLPSLPTTTTCLHTCLPASSYYHADFLPLPTPGNSCLLYYHHHLPISVLPTFRCVPTIYCVSIILPTPVLSCHPSYTFLHKTY